MNTQALPISNARLASWIWLSIELMALTAVVAAYWVLRGGAAGGDWPDSDWVHSSQLRGLGIATFLLLTCRGLQQTVACASEATRAKRWLWWSLAYACLTLTILTLDVEDKVAHGLYPSRQHPQVFAQADLSYLSAVSANTNEQILRLESDLAAAKTNASRKTTQNELDRWRLFSEGIVGWTSQRVGRTDDPMLKQLSLLQLADWIFPTRADSRLEKFKKDESQEVLNQFIEKIVERVPPNDLPKRTPDHHRAEGLGSRVEAGGMLANQLQPFRRSIRGVLPKVIPGGPAWLSCFYLLSGFLWLHIAVGVIAVGSLFFIREPAGQLALQNVTAYWYFVALAGMILLLLAYFI